MFNSYLVRTMYKAKQRKKQKAN